MALFLLKLNMRGYFSLMDSDLNFLYTVTPGAPIKKEYLLLEI